MLYGLGFRVWALGFGGLEYRVLGFRVWGLEFRFGGLGFRVWVVFFRVWGFIPSIQYSSLQAQNSEQSRLNRS